MITQMLLASGGPPPIVTYVSNNAQTNNASSYTWTDQATGATKGHLIIGIFSEGGSAAMTSLTLNGVAAPIPLVLINDATETMGLYVVPMPATGLMTIATVFGSVKAKFMAAMWRVENLQSMVARDSDDFPAATGQPSTTVNINPADAFAISMAARTTNTGGGGFDWTNAVEDFEVLAGGEAQLAGATTEGLTGSTTITATWGGGSAGEKIMVTAVLR